MLAIAELEFLPPGERFRDVHMDVLRRLQIDQDEGPEQSGDGGEADHEPEARLRIAGTRYEPCRRPAEAERAARARGRQGRCSRHNVTRSAFSPPMKSAKREEDPLKFSN